MSPTTGQIKKILKVNLIFLNASPFGGATPYFGNQ